MEIQVSYLVNTSDNETIRVRNVVRNIDPKLIFGDDVEEVGQVNAFYMRHPWQTDTLIEFCPRPYYWGQV